MFANPAACRHLAPINLNWGSDSLIGDLSRRSDPADSLQLVDSVSKNNLTCQSLALTWGIQTPR